VNAGCNKPSRQAIRRELEQYLDTVGHGRLYTNLDTLVEKSTIDQRTNYNELTAAGSKTAPLAAQVGKQGHRDVRGPGLSGLTEGGLAATGKSQD